MYDAYCWLSNNVGPTSTSTRVPMLFAMAAFLVLAIAVPAAYDEDRWLFAAAYLAIVIVHGVSLLRSSLGGSARAILAIAPVNLGGAAMLFVAAALPRDLRLIAWIAAVAISVGAMVSRARVGLHDPARALRGTTPTAADHRARGIGHRDRGERRGTHRRDPLSGGGPPRDAVDRAVLVGPLRCGRARH